MEYVVGNPNHYVKEKDGKKIFGGGGSYVVFFSPNEHGGNYIYTNQLDGATKFKTLEKAQSVARPGGLDVWEYTVDENGCTHLSKAKGQKMSKKKNKYVLGTQDHKLLLSSKSNEAGKEVMVKKPTQACIFNDLKLSKRVADQRGLNVYKLSFKYIPHDFFSSYDPTVNTEKIVVLGRDFGDQRLFMSSYEQGFCVSRIEFSTEFSNAILMYPAQGVKVARRKELELFEVHLNEVESNE